MKNQSVNTRRKQTATLRMEKIARLRVERPGITNQQIADELFINVKSVSRLSVQIDALWKERAMVHRDDHVARQLAVLDHVEEEAWKAWGEKRWAREKVIKSTTMSEDGAEKGRRSNVLIINEQTNLGIECLKTVLQCQERRAALLGLDAPKKAEVSVVFEKLEEAHRSLVAILADVLTPAQFETIAQRLETEKATLRAGLPMLDLTATAVPSGA